MSEEIKDSAALDPESSPGGLKERKLPTVRRINNMPLFIGIGAIGLVLMVFLYVILDRSQQQKEAINATSTPIETDEKNITRSTLSYNELVAGVGDGLIPSDQMEPLKPLDEESVVKESPSEPVDLLASQGGEVLVDPLQVSKPIQGVSKIDDRQLERISETKAQRAEAAIFAGTSVDFSEIKSANNEGDNRLDRAQSALDKYREKLLGMQSGGSGLDGLLGGDGESNTGNNSQFLDGGKNNWTLLGSRQAGEHYSVKSGAIIPAIMINGINSDLPGQVIAQVSENVYDSSTGYELLIPQGTRLVGEYNSEVIFGQSRVMLRWDRLVFPDGSTLNLMGMAGADKMGYSGFKDKVNNHYWRLFGNAFMLSLISAGYQSSLPENKSSINNNTTVEEQIAINMAENFNEVGSELIRRNLNIQPTIEIRPGYKFNVMVNKDVVFDSQYKSMASIN